MVNAKYLSLSIFLVLALVGSMMAVLLPAAPAESAATSITINYPTSDNLTYVKPGGPVEVGFTTDGTTGQFTNISCEVFNTTLGTIYNQTWSTSDNSFQSMPFTINSTAPQGTYNVKLTRADLGTVTTTNTSSVIVDSTAPIVALTTPNSSSCWKGNTANTIQWAANDAASTDDVTIYAYLDTGSSSTAIIPGVSYSQGAQILSYIAPAITSQTCKILMNAVDRAGNRSDNVSTSYFSILNSAPTPVLTSPNGGEIYNGSSAQTITGTVTGTGTSCFYWLKLYTDSPATSANITSSWQTGTYTGGLFTLSYPWTVPSTVRNSTCRIELTARDCAYNSASDNSNATFRIKDIVAPAVTVTAPTTGTTWYSGTTQTITWTQTDNVPGSLASTLLYYTTNGGTDWFLIGSGGDLTQGSGKTYSWLVPSGSSANCKIKVVATDLESPGNAGTGYSGTFSIASSSTVPSVTVGTPNGGESWQVGSTQSITWAAADSPDATARMRYTIVLQVNGTDTTTIADLTNQPQCSGGTCSYSWAVSNVPTTQATIKITATDPATNTAVDTSNAVFSITAAACGVETGTVTLYQGWNLISLPISPTNTNIDSVLSSIIPSVTSVWIYDSTCPSTSASWYSYAPGAPSTLLTMDAGKAYWINMATGGSYSLTFQGRKCPCPPSAPTTFTVCRTGWNMVGFKSTIAKPAQTYLASLGTPTTSCGTAYLAPINGYNGSSQTWTTVNCADNMTPGSGYWIYINTTGTINPGCD